ncbi:MULTISPECIES: DoxX family protein [Demequina]|uniref:DoxX family protein n=1 Tax=Demequina TaxID=577469 RepID=UPI000780C872|nr:MULTISPECIES: DoxX family protein [Demequina]
MSLAIWIVSGVLAAMYLTAGLMKSFTPREHLLTKLPWVEDYSASTVKLIGWSELLGALGLVLPWALDIAPALTPIAATGLVLIQALAIRAHIRRGETNVIAFNAVLLIAAAFVAVTRFMGL